MILLSLLYIPALCRALRAVQLRSCSRQHEVPRTISGNHPQRSPVADWPLGHFGNALWAGLKK